jgi:hypothetical protein
VAILFSLAVLLGALLLFSMEPMIAKMVLPQYGGAPAVWNTCMVFFQAALLAGYAYAHAATTWLGVRRQVFLQAALVLLPLAVLPVMVPHDLAAHGEETPVLSLLGLLAATIGLPFFVVSTSGPLLQRWFSMTHHPAAADPYFLYGASNAGSMLGLLAYPALLEPYFLLGTQSLLWLGGFAVFVVLTFGCALAVWRYPDAASGADAIGGSRTEPRGGTDRRLAPRDRLRWLALAFVPSSLMLGVTTYLSTDIAAVPLLWTVPLALYLLSFMLAFGGLPPQFHRVMVRTLPVAVALLAYVMLSPTGRSLGLLISAHLATFFVAAMVCHGELAASRPGAEHLTEYYLWISTGGVLGGIFNALVAPVIFRSTAEYPLALVLVCVLAPAWSRQGRNRLSSILDLVLPGSIGLLVLGLNAWWRTTEPSWAYGIAALACLPLAPRPVRFGLAVGVLFLTGNLLGTKSEVLHQERDFFGVHRVLRNPDNEVHWLIHGNVEHGAQRFAADRDVRNVPLTYYFPTGPIGQVFAQYLTLGLAPPVAVVGLGAGSLAAYAQAQQEFTFFEIDPAVVRIAGDPRFFTFLSDSRTRCRIILGDARLSLAQKAEHHYGLIVVDAFSSDAIPVHLLTREAVRVYFGNLVSGGVVALHISSNFFELEPVIGAIARAEGLTALAQRERPASISETERRLGKRPSHWVLLARDRLDFGRLADDPRWRPLAGNPGPCWSDDYSNLLAVLRW